MLRVVSRFSRVTSARSFHTSLRQNAKVVLALYPDPVSGYPPKYARNDVPKITGYPDGQTTPTPSAIDFTPGELLGCVSGELGLRKFLEKRGHDQKWIADLESSKSTNLPTFWTKVRYARRAGSPKIPSSVLNDKGSLTSSQHESLSVWSEHLKMVGDHDVLDPKFSPVKCFKLEIDSVNLINSMSPSLDPALDLPFSVDELDCALSTLRQTPAGFDNGYVFPLKSSTPQFRLALCSFLNCCLTSAYIPSVWRMGIVFPLFKKGNPQDLNNYRGITLQVITYKLLDILINNRLKKYLFTNKLISNLQAGYRAGYTALDWAFVLKQLILNHLKTKKPLFLCFFDVKKAFDRVWIAGLMLKLYRLGVRGPMLKLLFVMYMKSYSAYLVNNSLSQFVPLKAGVKQGGCTSPLLYLIFVNTLIDFLKKLNIGLSYGQIWLAVLLFCDDTVILANSAEELQTLIDAVHSHCQEWRFELSPSKTVVMTVACPFQSHQFTLNGEPLTEVEQTRYLGSIISRTGSDVPHFNHLYTNLLSAIKGLTILGLKSSNFSIHTVLKLTNTIVYPSASFGSEIHFPTKSLIDKCNRTVKKFIKKSFTCCSSFSNAALVGELQLQDFTHIFDEKALRYHARLLALPPSHPITHLFPDSSSVYNQRIQAILKKYNLSSDQMMGTKTSVAALIKSAIAEKILTSWNSDRKRSSTLNRLYNKFKQIPETEPYLELKDGYIGRLILKLRCGFSALNAHLQKYDNIPFERRLCPLCQLEPEDTIHFLSRCWRTKHVTNNLRTKLNFPSDTNFAKSLLMINESDPQLQPDIVTTLKTLYETRNHLKHNISREAAN